MKPSLTDTHENDPANDSGDDPQMIPLDQMTIQEWDKHARSLGGVTFHILPGKSLDVLSQPKPKQR